MSANVCVIGSDSSVNVGGLVNRAAKIGSIRVYNITVYNTGPEQWIQVFDAGTSQPAEGSVPLLQFKVPAEAPGVMPQGSLDWQDGRVFANGIFVCNSTTNATKTLGAVDCLIDITYRKIE